MSFVYKYSKPSKHPQLTKQTKIELNIIIFAAKAKVRAQKNERFHFQLISS